jgi:hypothetical protein
MADERGRSGRRQQHRIHHKELVRNARNRPELGGLLSITSFNQSGNKRADERFDDIETFEYASRLFISELMPLMEV